MSRAGNTAKKRRVRLEGGVLRVGDDEQPLYSGAMHYFRLRPERWRAGLVALKDLGLEMVETYVPWSVHERERGKLDFGQGDPRLDLGRFLDMAAEEGLRAFVRPGPHINAELTDFGLPRFVLEDKAVQARSPRQNPVILSFPPRMFPVPSYASDTYHRLVGGWFDAVAEVVKPRLYPDGNVVLLQVDNEATGFFRDGPFGQDYHPDAVALYRRFLLARHGDLEALGRAHGEPYASVDDVVPPTEFRPGRQALTQLLDWAAFREHLMEHALGRMRRRMSRAGLSGVPVVHNLPLGDGGQAASVPALEKTVSLVGFDYYHAAREHRTIKRRTLALAGSSKLAYAPEMGAGAPPWFTPLSHEDSLYCAQVACAYGLRGFNLYMTVDRDRWYGAPIDAMGRPRPEARAWKAFFAFLTRTRFFELERKAEVALVIPREYRRLARISHTLGPISPSTLEAIGASPVDACRRDTYGFSEPIQLRYWHMLASFARALTAAGIPYLAIDSDAPPKRFEGYAVVYSPTWELADDERLAALDAAANSGARLVIGPRLPEVDSRGRATDWSAPAGTLVLDAGGDDEVTECVAQLDQELGLAHPFRAHPTPVETSVHDDADGPRVLFVINPSRRAQRASVVLPRPMRLRDALSLTALDAGATLELDLPGQSCRIFELESRPRARRTSTRPEASANQGESKAKESAS
ncbi:MAG: hypothetical protein GXP55_18395 [Deltaproteobacteria bacterium]|nr:hypothetical protein [Deltaproteobacteria bacterium]